MKLKILWFYHNIMDLYGDSGNIKVLKKRCLDRNIEVIVDTLGLNEDKELNEYDLIFIGGGADNEQSIIYNDLISRKSQILNALESKTFFLLICGGYQLFGQYYKDQDGKIIDGLKIFDYYTKATNDGRCIGNILINVKIDDEDFNLVGFENHGGQTHNVTTPLGKVIKGHGNMLKSEYEGFYNGQVLGTYLHGPLLPKNVKLADLIIKKALAKRYGNVELIKLDDKLEDLAHNIMSNRLTN